MTDILRILTLPMSLNRSCFFAGIVNHTDLVLRSKITLKDLRLTSILVESTELFVGLLTPDRIIEPIDLVLY